MRLNPFAACWSEVDRFGYFDAWRNRYVPIEERIEQVAKNNTDNPLVEGGFLLIGEKGIPIPPKYHKKEPASLGPNVIKEEYRTAYTALDALRILINQIDPSKARSFFGVTLPNPADNLTLSWQTWRHHYRGISTVADSAWEALGRAVRDANITVSASANPLERQPSDTRTDPSLNGANGSEKGPSQMNDQEFAKDFEKIAGVPLNVKWGKQDLRKNVGELRDIYRIRWLYVSRLAQAAAKDRSDLIPDYNAYMEERQHPNSLAAADRSELFTALTAIEVAFDTLHALYYPPEEPAPSPEPEAQAAPAQSKVPAAAADAFTDALVTGEGPSSDATSSEETETATTVAQPASEEDTAPEMDPVGPVEGTDLETPTGDFLGLATLLEEEDPPWEESTTIERIPEEQILADLAASTERELAYIAEQQAPEQPAFAVEQRAPLTLDEMNAPAEEDATEEVDPMAHDQVAKWLLDQVHDAAQTFLMAYARHKNIVQDVSKIEWMLDGFYDEQHDQLFPDAPDWPSHREEKLPFPRQAGLAFSITVDDSENGRTVVYALTLPGRKSDNIPPHRVTLTQSVEILK